MPKTQPRSLQLSPSLYHKYLMDHEPPSMSYQGGDVKTWQRRLRNRLRQQMGLQRNTHTLTHPEVLWERPHPLGHISKIAFNAQPGSDIVAYLCLPKEGKAPYPTFICLQGHTTGMHYSIAVEREDESKAMEVEGDRDFGLHCMRRGWAALCIEQRSFGLRREHEQPTNTIGCQAAAVHALMLGRTLAGERVFDVDRGLDYLATRSDIDMKRVGVMGNSGGGTISIYAAALLDRIAFAMPSCSFCTYRDSIMSISHCVDNYVPGLLQYAESADIVGLAAPKPMVLVSGKDDDIFPIKAARKAFTHVKAIYEAAGSSENCKHVIGNGGHRFYAEQGWKAMLQLVS